MKINKQTKMLELILKILFLQLIIIINVVKCEIINNNNSNNINSDNSDNNFSIVNRIPQNFVVKIKIPPTTSSSTPSTSVTETTTTTTTSTLSPFYINDKRQIVNNNIHNSGYVNQNVYNNSELTPLSIFANSPRSEQQHWRNQRSVLQKNVCQNECECITANSFTTVTCNLVQNKLHIFGPTKYIPRQASSLIIKISPSGQLRLDEGLFNNNNINKILIYGEPGNRQHIELGENAFIGNDAALQQIDIVDCHSVFLRTNAFKGEFTLNITNCKEVNIFTESFTNANFHGHFENIQDLRFYEKPFHNTTGKIFIINCNIDELNRMDGFREIRFSNTEIKKIKTGAFNFIEIHSLIFENCYIRLIESNTITEKLHCDSFTISGSKIDLIESNAISGSGIRQIIIQNNTIKSIQENALQMTGVTVSITNNTINKLGQNWFMIKDWNEIHMNNNRFGLFNKMFVDRTANPVQCEFHSNSITITGENCLNFTSTYCTIRDITLSEHCTCNTEWINKLTNLPIKSETYCTVDETLKHCINSSLLSVEKFEQIICTSVEKELDCKKKRPDRPVEGNFVDIDEIHRDEKERIYKENIKKISIIICATLLLSIILLILFIIMKKYFLRRKSSSVTMSDLSASEILQHQPNFNCTMETDTRNPSGRITTGDDSGVLRRQRQQQQSQTFSHDDRIIIKQTLVNMKKKYPIEKYDQVYNNTQKLLNGNLTETEKVLTIGEIVKCLGELKNSGDDFVAFTDILYKHLAPNSSAYQNDPVYDEPTGGAADTNLTEDGDDEQTNLDHIYAEPNHIHQPLLINEYALPIDKNNDQNSANLYTEPENSRKIINPYAIGSKNCDNSNQLMVAPKVPPLPIIIGSISKNYNQQQQQQQQQPSTSKNLPDILSSGGSNSGGTSDLSYQQPSTSRNFANNQQFHITRSPTTNRKIPKYTIPNPKLKNFKFNTKSSGSAGNGPASTTSSHTQQNSLLSSESNSNSDHSGGSDVTVKIDDIIEYADA